MVVNVRDPVKNTEAFCGIVLAQSPQDTFHIGMNAVSFFHDLARRTP
jgi:hypothetical protein